MAKRIAFDVQAAIAAAWDLLWAENLKQRKKEKDGRWHNATFYLCAVDIESQVRAFAEDSVNGRPWRNTRTYGQYPSLVRIPGNLPRMVREWLFAQVRAGKLQYHNFGRGHISGARFRPYGAPMGPSEIETIRRKADERSNPKPKLIHFSEYGYSGRPLCTKKKRSSFSRRNHRVRCSKEREEISCPRCNNLLKDYVPPQHE